MTMDKRFTAARGPRPDEAKFAWNAFVRRVRLDHRLKSEVLNGQFQTGSFLASVAG